MIRKILMLYFSEATASKYDRRFTAKLPGVETMLHTLSTCLRLASLGSIAVLLLGADANAAVTQKVKSACKNDYFAHCSQHAVGSSALRTCMRDAQDSLSKPCLQALVDDGEVSKDDINRYKSRRPK